MHAEALSIHSSQTVDNSQAVNSSRGATVSSASAVFSDASWLNDVSLGEQPQQRQQQEKPNQLNPDTNVRTNGQFLYCYVTESGQESGDQAEADIGYEDSVAYLIKCRKAGNFLHYSPFNHLFLGQCRHEHNKLFSDLEQSGKRFKLVTESLEGHPDLCLAYMNERDCQDPVQIPNWNGTNQFKLPIKTPPKKQQVKSTNFH